MCRAVGIFVEGRTGPLRGAQSRRAHRPPSAAAGRGAQPFAAKLTARQQASNAVVYSLRAARNDRVKLVHKALAQRLCVLHPLGAMAEKTKTGTRKMGRTGYFSHKDCWKHEMGPGHPECPERLDAIEDRLLITGVFDGWSAWKRRWPRWPMWSWPMTACMWRPCAA
jgi:hypothetical protein